MILLYTDFGTSGPYVGQLHAVLAREAPGLPVIDLQHDAPRFDPKASAYLLAALAAEAPPGSVLLAVVDPGVGTARAPLAVQAGGLSFVGPDNGLLALVARRAAPTSAWRIDWRPERLSPSFHGRDLFGPVAAMLARGRVPAATPLAPDSLVGADWPDTLAEVVYLDAYGNAMTGLRAAELPAGTRLSVGGQRLAAAETFGGVAPGEAFWYANSCGLAEIAVNQGSAAQHFGLRIGSPIGIEDA
ncbi:SAM hydrolase/SAM-dependent halogenase family protein [Algihabitans albus]|uniref:SAM hydrolase/SAM-dependent halogenase family protein n=1 Tax=Algihabitans albus TaxID=2164067 RepID=UPI000E5D15C0|nr:SAM-dependent chlorinase/fluorinase [Algihabitans albus]